MAIKGGQILHVIGGPAATFVVDRIQTAGVTGISVNEERIEELGNYQTIGTVRDIPDVTFEIESFDPTTEIESLLTDGNNAEADGTMFDLADFVPINIASPFKSSGTFDVAMGIAIPFLNLESASYAFSLGDPATLNVTLRGDSVFYSQGGIYQETFSGNAATTAFNFVNGPAYRSVIAGDEYFALVVMVKTTEGWERMRLGSDYTNTATGVTFLTAPATGTNNIKLMYSSGTAQEFLQSVHDSVKPTAVRGPNIFVSVEAQNWVGVQSASVDWSVTLERDEEFGNPTVVAHDYETPEVSGSITMKPSTVTALSEQIKSVMSITGTDIVNATQDPLPLSLAIRLTDPSTGDTLKTLVIPDAKFTAPSIQGQVGSKLETEFSFTSESGVLQVWKGDAPEESA